jgi:hypothetical protein
MGFYDESGYYDKFNIPEISGYPDSSSYEPIPYYDTQVSAGDLAPEQIEMLSIGQDINTLDPNVPSNKADISYLLSQMSGRYDDEGYYGLSQGQVDAARRAGLGALGANMAMGALSGTWQGFGEGNIKGLMAEKAARDAALKGSSDQNLAADKQKIDFAKDEISIESAKLQLSDAKEESKAKSEGRKAALAMWKSTKEQREAAIAAMPAFEQKKAKRIEQQAEVFIAAGKPEEAMKLMDLLDNIGPDADKYMDDRKKKDAVVQAEAEVAGGKVKSEAENAAVHQKFVEGGLYAKGYREEQDHDGNIIIVSPNDLAVRSQNAKTAGESAAYRSVQAQIARERLEKMQRDNDFGVTTGVVKPAVIDKLVEGQNKAVRIYNAGLQRFGPNAPPVDTLQDPKEQAKAKSEWLVAAGTLQEYGILPAENIGKPLTKTWNDPLIRAEVIKGIRSYQDRERRALAAQGIAGPAPTEAEERARGTRMLQDVTQIKTAIEQIKNMTHTTGTLTFDQFLAGLDTAYGPGYSDSLKSDPMVFDVIKRNFYASPSANPGTGSETTTPIPPSKYNYNRKPG